MIDDANAPGLLSLPYLGFCVSMIRSTATRQFVLGEANPYFSGAQRGGCGGRMPG